MHSAYQRAIWICKATHDCSAIAGAYVVTTFFLCPRFCMKFVGRRPAVLQGSAISAQIPFVGQLIGGARSMTAEAMQSLSALLSSRFLDQALLHLLVVGQPLRHLGSFAHAPCCGSMVFKRQFFQRHPPIRGIPTHGTARRCFFSLLAYAQMLLALCARFLLDLPLLTP